MRTFLPVLAELPLNNASAWSRSSAVAPKIVRSMISSLMLSGDARHDALKRSQLYDAAWASSIVARSWKNVRDSSQRR